MSLAVLCLLGVMGVPQQAPRPNIVFLLADDLGYADCGFNGGVPIQTPALDRLAAAGTVLESFYAQPVCSPTRASLMTGRYPFRYGLQVGVVRPWAEYGLPLAERTLPQALREAGYRTAICGKWHLGSFDQAYWPQARGFDHAYGHLFGAIDYFTHERDGVSDWFRNGERLEEEGYSTHLIAREAVAFIEQQDRAQPFFLYVPFNAVHAPYQVPESYMEPYEALPGPRRTLAGMLAALDEAVGQITAAIERKGLRDQTLFVFSSDNGGVSPGRVTDNTPLRAGKGTVYEGGVRVCAFATWNGQIPAGKRLAEPLHMVDWYPTLLGLAGAAVEQPLPLDGLDAWPVLTQGKPSRHDSIVLQSEPSRGAIRQGDWKLVLLDLDAKPADRASATPRKQQAKKAASRPSGPTIELYNLSDDLSETRDLSADQPARVAELRALYDQYASQAATPLNPGDSPGGSD